MIRNSFDRADEQGLTLPEDSQALRSQLAAMANTSGAPTEEAIRNWPPRDLLSVVGLAQHHGIPTRLLDWSWSPTAAAYFAAVGAAKRLIDNSTQPDQDWLRVWALSRSLLSKPLMNRDGAPDPDLRQLEFVTAPGSSNTNLRAQEGLFVLVRSNFVYHPDSEVDRQSIDNLLAHTNIQHSSAVELYEVRLPVSKARRLLKILARLGATGARYFPSFDGIARSIREERELWD